MKLLRVVKSEKPEKKWKAIFQTDSGSTKTTHFGQAGAPDYTLTGDKDARERYRKRHQKDLMTEDPTRAGFLSMFLLWGNSTSLEKNIADYRQRFDL